MSAPALNPERRRRKNIGGYGGYPLPGIGYLGQNFVSFKESLLGHKASKSEGHYVESIIEINLESHNLVQNTRIYKWTFNPNDHIECRKSKHSLALSLPDIKTLIKH